MEKKFVCPECRLPYRQICHLKRHYTKKHPDKVYFSGNVIKRKEKLVFRKADDVPIARKMTAKAKEDPVYFHCPYCNWKNKTVRRIREHLMDHFQPYQCSLCDFVSAKWQVYAKHLYFAHGHYNCGTCEFISKNQVDMDQHYVNTHDGATREFYECPELVCNKTFPTQWRLKIHQIIYHSDVLGTSASQTRWGLKQKQGKYVCCPYCKYSTTKINNLKNHLMIHAMPYQCGKCNKKFCKYEVFRSHGQRYHQKSTCPKCFILLEDAEEVAKHIGEVHERHLPELVCEKCTEKFEHDWELTIHETITHELIVRFIGEKPEKEAKPKKSYDCSKCGWSGKPDTIRKHLMGHIKPYTCSECKYKSDRQLRLAQHAKSLHSKLLCKLCNSFFKDDSSLNEHFNQAHSTIIPLTTKPYNCLHCEATFDARPQYELHHILKHSLSLIECEKCDFVSTCSTLLSSHSCE